MTDPVRPPSPLPGSPLEPAPPRTRRRSNGPGPRSGRAACSPATSACGPTDPRVAETISERLGWLDAPEHFTEQIPGLEGFGDAVVDEGYTTAVVAGMGGSSLAPDILRRTFGTTEGYLELRILDSTDPAYVARDARRPRSAADARHHRLEVRHHDRAERVPRVCLGAGRGGSQGRPPPSLRAPGRLLRRSSRTPARATRSRTPTTSARSSSTRPTSAGAIPR